MPLGDGSQTVTIYDLCIDMPEPMTATIFVSGVGSVQLFVMDKVSTCILKWTTFHGSQIVF